MMNEKRFKLIKGVKVGTHSGIWDNRKQHNMGIGDELWVGEVVAMLNEGVAIVEENKELKKENEQLRKYNGQLKERLEKINHGYGHLTHRKGLTANEWLIESQEKELKTKNEQISDWIKQHSKDIVTIGEQKATIKSKDKQLERLYNYFQDYLKDEMSGNAFSEMWDFVKEDEKWEDE